MRRIAILLGSTAILALAFAGSAQAHLICQETTNPHGKNVPPAGSTTLPGPKGGQNDDGFYLLTADRDVLRDLPNLQVFVRDTGSGTVFGPFRLGTKIKYTEANGTTPGQKKIGSTNGQSGAVLWHINGTGDAEIFASDPNITPASCKVPPPPK